MAVFLEVTLRTQKMQVLSDNETLIKEYLISTAKNGPGEEYGSEKTPRGLHIIRAKIGGNAEINTVFVKRRSTNEIYTTELKLKFPERDWMLTRILWLCGLERGKNRFGNVDSMKRKIYIHGAPDEVAMGMPGSRGCIRMRNTDIMELFDQVEVGTRVIIKE
jgi:L,D-transpeptidase YbiS